MSRAERIRERIPAPLRPFTRGVWPFVWVGVVSAGALWLLGGEMFGEASALRERARTQRRLAESMRAVAASEDVERARAEALARWADEDGPARVTATSVEIALSRLQESVQNLVASAGADATAQQFDRNVVQVETLVERMPDGSSLHLVRTPLAVSTETMETMSRVIAAVESSPTLWLRPGNATLSVQQTRRGPSPRLNIAQVWAVVEVRPEGT